MADVYADIKIPDKLVPLFTTPDLRFKGAHGGRGGAKSFTFAKMLAVDGYVEPMPILVGREYLNSIKDSAFAEIRRAILSERWLANEYKIGDSYIKGRNGTEFIFKGLHHNYEEVKGIAGIKRLWVDEADPVSEETWSYLTPTIREPGSQIWLTWNTSTPETATYKRFIRDAHKLARAMIVKINYNDNPWFTRELEEERQTDLQGDPDHYANKWDGEPLTRSDAQVMGGRWELRDFTPVPGKWNGPYQGLDFGFSNDPTAGVRCWIWDNCLYIEYAAGGVGIDLDDIRTELGAAIPGFDKNLTRADNSRPDSISYLRKNGMPRVVPCDKGKNSIEDGVEHIKSFKRIYIHPRAVPMEKEARLYLYKVDRLSGQVLNIIVDANNHWWDAVRYALEPVRKQKGSTMAAMKNSPYAQR